MKVIVSVVGTSILTNQPIDNDIRNLLIKTANKTKSDIEKDDLDIINKRIDKLEAILDKSDVSDWKKRSAEANGILSYGVPDKSDSHLLLSTDTYQGRQTARLIQKFLKSCGCTDVQIFTPDRFTTSSAEDFRKGMVQVVEWCEQTVKSYKDKNYHVVFNLTGGFKAVQGYMNTLGMIHADEIIYTFENEGSELIRIPHLPLEIDNSLAEENAVTFAILNHIGQIDCKKLNPSGVSELYIESVNIDGVDYCSLTAWGKLIWLKCKKDVLSGKLHDWPMVRVEDSFKRDFDRIQDKDFRADIQDAVSRASALLLESNGDIGKLKEDGGIQYEVYKNKDGIGHFRVSGSRRISCKPIDGILALRHCGEHDVNDNP